MIVLVLLFAIRGYLRGTVAQVFVVVGLLAGIYTTIQISRWVGDHWGGARPIAAYVVMRWIVAALVGLALATAFRWWGNSVAKAVREGPLNWLDRGVGLVIGTALGTTICTFGLLGALQFDHPRGPGMAVARARVGAQTMGAAASVCAFSEAFLPGGVWLKQQFLAAERRAVRMRALGSTTAKR